MRTKSVYSSLTFASTLALAMYFTAIPAVSAEVGALLNLLKTPDLPNWEEVEGEIIAEWSKSGSASMDLLLRRGQQAMDDDDIPAAIDHFTALTDHAPDFAEGWQMRATAYFRAEMLVPALADLERTLVLNPDHFAALQGVGIISEIMELPDQAMRAYRASIAIHPNDPDIKEGLERVQTLVNGITL